MSLLALSPRLLAASGALVLAFAMSSCSSGEEPAPASGGDGEVGAQDAPADPTGATEGESEASDPDDDNRFGADLETTGEVIVETFAEADGFTVDDTTLTVTFSAGEASFDGSLDCLSVNGLMKPGETLILSYPDGPVTC